MNSPLKSVINLTARNNRAFRPYSFKTFAIALLLGASTFSAADAAVSELSKIRKVVTSAMMSGDASMTRRGDFMEVNMKVDFEGLKIKSPGAVVVTPMIVNGADTARLASVGVYGRTAWYASRRNGRLPMGGTPQRTLRYKKHMAPIDIADKVRYEEWMNGADLMLEVADYGCAGCNRGKMDITDLAHYQRVEYEPTFIYETAVAQEVKTRELSGRAFVDFPVNKTEIYPTYRRNTVELNKIIATIDSVKNDKDVTVTSISIKGFASPEGSYANNTRLAQGRTEALKNYVQTLYHFPYGFIKTSFDPEDWGGLREYVNNSTMPDRYGILSIIDDPYMDPDTKDHTIKSRYPSSYAFLLQNVYPALRHSDYRIEYEIRSFSDPVEIREMIVKEPQKLSLNEIYLAVQDLEPGSEEYNDIFETAARLFPNEPTANLNAANAMMQRGDLVGAARYLQKAGDSPEAIYARGVLAGLNGDFTTALELVEQAISLGVEDDGEILEHLKEAAQYSM